MPAPGLTNARLRCGEYRYGSPVVIRHCEGDYPGLDWGDISCHDASRLENVMARRPKPVPQMTVAQFDAIFSDETACKTYLQARRWPEGIKCPRCGDGSRIFPVKTMPFKWQCYACTPVG